MQTCKKCGRKHETVYFRPVYKKVAPPGPWEDGVVPLTEAEVPVCWACVACGAYHRRNGDLWVKRERPEAPT